MLVLDECHVSEELNSVETVILVKNLLKKSKVSEELNSVETKCGVWRAASRG